jgi:adenosylhomocysteinase
LAEHEMPGLMSLRREYADVLPLKGAASPARCTRADRPPCWSGPSSAGRQVRWASAASSPRRDHAARGRSSSGRGATEPTGAPVFAWKGGTLEGTGGPPSGLSLAGEPASMILDGGGDDHAGAARRGTRGRCGAAHGTTTRRVEGFLNLLRGSSRNRGQVDEVASRSRASRRPRPACWLYQFEGRG